MHFHGMIRFASMLHCQAASLPQLYASQVCFRQHSSIELPAHKSCGEPPSPAYEGTRLGFPLGVVGALEGVTLQHVATGVAVGAQKALGPGLAISEPRNVMEIES